MRLLPTIKFIKNGVYRGKSSTAAKGHYYLEYRLFGDRCDAKCRDTGFFLNRDTYDIIREDEEQESFRISAPAIVVCNQKNFFKTMDTSIHEFIHYIIWLLLYRGNTKHLNRFRKITDFYDKWYRKIFIKWLKIV